MTENSPGLEHISMVFRAETDEQGQVTWKAVISDTGLDRAGEQATLPLYQDWINRIEGGIKVSFLPPPRMPFLSVSHYPALDGFGEAGEAVEYGINEDEEGTPFWTSGVFADGPLGQKVRDVLRSEQSLVEAGELKQEPIRISAAWYDLAHAHGNQLFVRKSLKDHCPLCKVGVGKKRYMWGQLDHLAGTRVPLNPRTEIVLEEKSMTTKKEDAATIVGEKLAEELEERTKTVVGKSEAGLVIKAEEEKATQEQSQPTSWTSVTPPAEETPSVMENPYRMALAKSQVTPTQKAVTFDQLETQKAGTGTLEQLADFFGLGHQIAMSVFEDSTLEDRPLLLVRALADLTSRAAATIDSPIDITERAKKKGGKKGQMPPWLKDKIQGDDDEEDEEEETKKTKAETDTGDAGADEINKGDVTPMSEEETTPLVEAASQLGAEIEQIAKADTGTRQEKYTAVEPVVERYLEMVQRAIDEETAPTLSGESELASTLQQYMSQQNKVLADAIGALTEVAKSMALSAEKTERAATTAPSPTQQFNIPPVQRSVAPPAPVAPPAEGSQPTVVEGLQPGPTPSLRNMVRRSLNLPVNSQ
jgi:hypothetical protein